MGRYARWGPWVFSGLETALGFNRRKAPQTALIPPFAFVKTVTPFSVAAPPFGWSRTSAFSDTSAHFLISNLAPSNCL